LDTICFPANAQLRRLNKGTGVFETIAVEQLAIGDTVECLKPTDAGNGTVSGFTYGVCDVYYYVNAKRKETFYEYINLRYIKDDLSEGLFRASPNHGIILPAQAISPSNPLPAPGPGTIKPMTSVQVGDRVAVANANRMFYTANVISIQRSYEAGAYSPLLTDAGNLIVDGVMAFYTSGRGAADPKRAIAGYLSSAPVWQRYLSGNSSNCIQQSAGSCPCLDQGAPCVKQGDALQNMPDKVSSWYFQEVFKVQYKAASEGRTKRDNDYLYDAFKAGLAANTTFGFQQALDVLDAHWKTP